MCEIAFVVCITVVCVALSGVLCFTTRSKVEFAK